MLRIGSATRVITPDRPAVIPGQMHARVGREAVDPLTLTALALDGGRADGRAIFISCDITNFNTDLQDAVSNLVYRHLPELAGSPIIMNATHTHDGFLVKDGAFPHVEDGRMTAAEGRSWLCRHAVAAAVEAWGQRRNRQIGRAFAHAVVGHNRRSVFANGVARMYGKTNDIAFRHIEGYEDHSIDLIFIWEENGPLAGIIVDIPCPSQVEENLDSFSADFWHDIRLELRRRLGHHIFILPLCGAAGDQSPHVLLYARQEAEMRTRTGHSERQVIARRVADAVDQALACTRPLLGHVPLVCASVQPLLPGRTITNLERDWAEARRTEAIQRDPTPGLWWPRRLQEVVDRFSQHQPMPDIRPTLHVVRLGDAVIASNPFELYLDYGLQIKARSPAAQTFLVQLAGGSEGYLASSRSILTGDYGSHPASSPVGAEGGQVLVEATLDAIASLFPEVQCGTA